MKFVTWVFAFSCEFFSSKFSGNTVTNLRFSGVTSTTYTAYARETHRIHLYFGEFWLFCKCFLCVSIRDNALVKHTGSTYYKWFLVISCSNTWVRKAQDVLRFEKSCQKWRNFDYKHILCLSHSSVWTWNAQDPLPFFNDLGIFGYFCKNETHRMCLWTFFC